MGIRQIYIGTPALTLTGGVTLDRSQYLSELLFNLLLDVIIISSLRSVCKA